MKRLFGFCNCLFLFFVAVSFACPAFASIFGTVRGIVHDVQHRPISGAHLQLHAKSSDWKRETLSDDEGRFPFDAVPARASTIHHSLHALLQYSADLLSDASSPPP